MPKFNLTEKLKYLIKIKYIPKWLFIVVYISGFSSFEQSVNFKRS